MKDDVSICAQFRVMQIEEFVTNIDMIFGIVPRLCTGIYGVQFPARKRDFSLFQNFRTDSGPT